MTEPEVREHILKEQNNSTESIPTDNKVINGATQKVAVLDGDFLKRKQYFENLYPGIEVLDKTSNKISYFFRYTPRLRKNFYLLIR